jgi:glutathione S-transferase
MAFTIEVPNNYGYVVLTCVVGQMVTSIYMGGPVMTGRKKFDVPYPNLYATPGYHKEADAFNRIQRGHQNMFEMMSTFSLMALIGGLKYPIACSVYSTLFNVGSVLFQKGYSDTTLDVATARYKKGGAIKWIGVFGAMGSTISVAGSMIGWW